MQLSYANSLSGWKLKKDASAADAKVIEIGCLINNLCHNETQAEEIKAIR